MTSLTERQRTALWYRAQGLTAGAIGRRLDPDETISAAGVQDLLHKSIVKLQARDATHAVFLALTRGIIGPFLDCGTRKAWLRHIRRQEQSCIACRKANTAYVRAQRDAQPPPLHDAGSERGRKPLPITPAQLRVLGAMRDGATTGVEIGAALGMSAITARKHVMRIMDKFEINRHTYSQSLTYGWAVEEAKRRGYLE